MFKHACPECATDLILCPGDLMADEVFLCEECDTRWAVCPDCGNLVDVDEDWDVGPGTCLTCAEPADVNVFFNPASQEFYNMMENIFNEGEK